MTAAQRHTPGPWRVSADEVTVGPTDGFSPFGACGCCSSPWMTADARDQQRADARLIAAAPDMLDALQAANEALATITAHEDDARYIMGNTNFEIVKARRDQIKAAIRLATTTGGET